MAGLGERRENRQTKTNTASGETRRRQDSSKIPLIRQNPFPYRTNVNEEYRGYDNVPHKPAPREGVEALNPDRMWKEYISKRCPLVIDGLIQDEEWQGEKWKDLEHLRSVAGSTQVKIEPIDPLSNHFGSGSKRKIVALKDFLDILQDEKQAGKWYMTTQYIDDDEEEDEEDSQSSTGSDLFDTRKFGQMNQSSTSTTTSSPTSLDPTHNETDSTAANNDQDDLPIVDLDFSLPPPTDALAHLFPLPTPKLMGGLVLQQCNLWLGNGTSGKSSGLHHDFHDNLYMVLSGRKRFLIWPPTAHRWLEPVGDIFRIHTNGLIEYDLPNEPVLRADGLSKAEAIEWRIRARKRALNEADEQAAQQAGEEKLKKSQRKGKQKQTRDQENAMNVLRQAELQKVLLTLNDLRNQTNGSDSLDSFSSSQQQDREGLLDEEYSDDEEVTEYSDEEDDEDKDETDARSKARYDRLVSLLGPIEDGSTDGSDSLDESQYSQSPPSSPQKNRRKRKRARSILRIAPGGLPGGLRGSLRDPEGRYDSDRSGDMSDEDDFLLAAMEDGGDLDQGEIFTLPMIPQIEGEWSDEEGDGIRVELVQEAEEDEDLSDDDVDEAEEDESEGLEKAFPILKDESGSDESDLHSNDVDNMEDDSEDDSENDSESDGASWTKHVEDGEALLDQLANLENSQANERKLNESIEQSESEDEEPSSFSQIHPQAMHWFFDFPDDPADSNQTIPDDPPRVPGGPTLVPRENCPLPIEIHLGPGQMLYLPASWYHEVTSYCEKTTEGKVENEVHMALNYWFHPPTAVGERENLPKRLRGPLDLDGNVMKIPVTTMNNKATASGAGSKSEIDATDAPSAQNPYIDKEVWDEIRRTVQTKIDKIRKKALEKAMKGGQSYISTDSSNGIGNGKRKAETGVAEESHVNGKSESIDSSTKRHRTMTKEEE